MKHSSAFVIAGTHSGVGKTTITLGLLAAFRWRGLKVQPFKIGPDFIDPGLHSVVSGCSSYNLDGWMLSKSYNLRSFRKNMQGKDAGVVEGMMGLYDGKSGSSDDGSTAEMAKQLRLPVVLVVDASAMARSVAPLLLGFSLFDRHVNLAGVIFNRVEGEGHLRYLKDALRSLPNLQCFGGIPFGDRAAISERHLGLMTAEEKFLDRRFVRRLASLVERHVDLEILLKKTRVRTNLWNVAVPHQRQSSNEGSTIAVARDRAFCFYYPDNLDLMRTAGARVTFFSPVIDRSLPAGTNALYLGGGYPELYARDLSRNRPMRKAIKSFVEAGGLVYAECGGLMYLAQTLIDRKNREHPMVGVYPFKTRMLPALKMLGYREVVFKKKSFLPHPGTARGHEFHYSELIKASAHGHRIQNAYGTSNGGEACDGYLYKNCLASYTHLHFGSNPQFARRFVRGLAGS